MTATITTHTASQINALIEASRYGRPFENERRSIVGDATSSNGAEAFFVAAVTDPYDMAGERIVYRVYSIQIADSQVAAYPAGTFEQLMDDYRTQAEAEAIAARYVATV